MEAPETVQEIFFSCRTETQVVTEHLIPMNGLAHVYAGEIDVVAGDNRFTIGPGETVLFKRNQLAKFTKHPRDGQPFKTISIFFTPAFLREYYTRHEEVPKEAVAQQVLRFGRNPLFDSLFDSILPYYEVPGMLPKELIDHKLSESMTILRTLDKRIDGILMDFAEPGKVDLAEFMQQNYAYNLSMERFGYLTGRSLATFKRDFQKIFQTSPQKWLLRRRLEQAHYLIAEKQQRPSEVYLEVGFENLSHFSTSFKQHFGYTPSSLAVSHLPNIL